MLSTHNAPSILLIGDPVTPAIENSAASLAWQGYHIEVFNLGSESIALFGQGKHEFAIVDIASAAALPKPGPGECPYLIAMVPPQHPDEAIKALNEYHAVALIELPPHAGLLAALMTSLCRRFGATLPDKPPRPLARAGEEESLWRLDSTHWILTAPSGRTVKLTHTETSFLLALATCPGEAMARSGIIAAMGHKPDYYDSRRLDTLVSRLRQKVEKSLGTPLPVRSAHAYGYAFASSIEFES